MKMKSKIIVYIIIMITLFQFAVYINYQALKKDNEKSVNLVAEKISIRSINEELENLEKLTIIKEEQLEGRWKCTIKVDGNSDDILNVINNLSKYSIGKYSISGENNNLNVELEIFR